MSDLKTLQAELNDARQELRNLTVLAMSPRLSVKEAWAVREAERSARAEVKLRIKALEYGKQQAAG
jgi:hypothetical protein